MKYVSTRGLAPALGFSDVLLAGLARDGGLYVPETWPVFSSESFARLAGRPYHEVAYAVIHPFVAGEIADADLQRMCAEAYATFRHPAVAPLVQTGPNSFILELFHGPTLAFKDVAMQLLARLMDHVLAERGRRATIVGATSGDTGGAAIEAFRGRAAADIFILDMTAILSQMHGDTVGPSELGFHRGQDRVGLIGPPGLPHSGDVINIDAEFDHEWFGQAYAAGLAITTAMAPATHLVARPSRTFLLKKVNKRHA